MLTPEYLEMIRTGLNRADRFAAFNRMQLTHVEENYAEAEMPISENCLNGLNVVQGGVIFTLADFAFSGAATANPDGIVYIGMNSSISYIRPVTGEKVMAKAKIVNRGRRTCICDVEVFNEKGKIAAKATFTGFVVEQKLNQNLKPPFKGPAVC